MLPMAFSHGEGGDAAKALLAIFANNGKMGFD